MKYLVILLCTLCHASLAAQTDYESGLDAYTRGAWDAAAHDFAAFAKTQPSAEVYYNLALAEYRRGRVGEAAWASACSAALGHVPANDSLKTTLQRALPVDLKPLPPSPLAQRWSSLALGLPDNVAAVLALAGALAAGTLVFFVLLRRAPPRRRTPVVATAAALLLFAGLAYALSLAKASARDNRSQGVVVSPTALYAAPSARSERLRDLPPGARFDLGEEVSGTWRVTLPTGVEGWVPATALRRVLSKDIPPESKNR